MTVVTQPTGLLQIRGRWVVRRGVTAAARGRTRRRRGNGYPIRRQRRRVPSAERAQYRLIIAAVGVLLFRSVVGTGTILGVVPMPIHHFLEHSLDFLIAAIVLYAVYAHAPGAVGNDAASD